MVTIDEQNCWHDIHKYGYDWLKRSQVLSKEQVIEAAEKEAKAKAKKDAESKK